MFLSCLFICFYILVKLIDYSHLRFFLHCPLKKWLVQNWQLLCLASSGWYWIRRISPQVHIWQGLTSTFDSIKQTEIMFSLFSYLMVTMILSKWYSHWLSYYFLIMYLYAFNFLIGYPFHAITLVESYMAIVGPWS